MHVQLSALDTEINAQGLTHNGGLFAVFAGTGLANGHDTVTIQHNDPTELVRALLRAAADIAEQTVVSSSEVDGEMVRLGRRLLAAAA